MKNEKLAVNEISRTQSVKSESAVLVGVYLSDREQEAVPLEELEGLAEAAGTRVVGKLTQRPRGPRRHDLPGQGQGAAAC